MSSALIDCYEKWLSSRLWTILLPWNYIQTFTVATPKNQVEARVQYLTAAYTFVHGDNIDTGRWNTRAPEHTEHRNWEKSGKVNAPWKTLSLLYVLSIDQISAYLANLVPGRGRSVLGVHCRDPHCQPTAPAPMTSSLCTIDQSRTGPALPASAVHGKYVTSKNKAAVATACMLIYSVPAVFLQDFKGGGGFLRARCYWLHMGCVWKTGFDIVRKCTTVHRLVYYTKCYCR